MKLTDAIKIANELECYTAFEIRSYGDNDYDVVFKKDGVIRVCDIPSEAKLLADGDFIFIKIPVVLE